MRIRSHVEDGEILCLVFEVELGECVRLCNVEIRIEGPASELVGFCIFSVSRL